MKLVAYLRVSGNSQADNTSRDNQLDAIKRECAHLGHELVKVFTEVGSASGKVKRQVFDEALAYMEDNRLDGLIVHDIDRYWRSVVRGLTTLDKYFSRGEYVFISVNQRFDTSTDEGWFMFTMFLVNAEYERRKIARRTNSGKQYLINHGFAATGTPKYGYQFQTKLVDGKARRIEVADKSRLETINRIKRERAEGRSLVEIANGLNNDGISASKGGSWSAKQVQRLC